MENINTPQNNKHSKEGLLIGGILLAVCLSFVSSTPYTLIDYFVPTLLLFGFLISINFRSPSNNTDYMNYLLLLIALLLSAAVAYYNKGVWRYGLSLDTLINKPSVAGGLYMVVFPCIASFFSLFKKEWKINNALRNCLIIYNIIMLISVFLVK